MTVSWPRTRGALQERTTVPPKSRVTVRWTALGAGPAPRPQPGTLSATPAATTSADAAWLSDTKDDVANPIQQPADMSGGIDRLYVIDVSPCGARRWGQG